MQTDEVHGVRFGERQGLSDETGEALAESIVEALHVVGQAGLFADGLMLLVGDDVLVGSPEVGVDDATAVVLGHSPP